MSNNRVEFLDALRGIAIIMVIITHASSIVGVQGAISHVTGFMAYGVQLFFVVSAYTIFMTYTNSVDRGDVVIPPIKR